jgi:aryl-alcohol dehydrogenase-like predicted oxidoreductase
MNDIITAGAFPLGDRVVKRLGYGAMQLAGPGVFGPPKDHDTAIAVLREAVASGVNHIDTSDYYGPHVTNKLIREALHPYPDDLVIVTKIGARRGPDASWNPAMSPADLKSAVEDNLRNLRLDVLEVVAVFGPRTRGRADRRRSRSSPIFSAKASCVTSASATSPQSDRTGAADRHRLRADLYNVAHREDDAWSTSLPEPAWPTRRSSRCAASHRRS